MRKRPNMVALSLFCAMLLCMANALLQTRSVSSDTSIVGKVDQIISSEALVNESAHVVQEMAPTIVCLDNGTEASCVDPRNSTQCTPGSSKKPAITFTFDTYIAWPHNETWYEQVSIMANKMGADLVLLLPEWGLPAEGKADPFCESATMGVLLESDVCKAALAAQKERVPLSPSQLDAVRKYFKIVRTPWIVPPRLSPNIPRTGGCCGAREFMKLYAMELEEYDAVVNLDTDVTIHGSLKPLFDCAASGRFLTARGTISGVNGGMFAVRPSKLLVNDMLRHLSVSSADDTTGWNKLGLAPGAKYGQGGLQGFLYYYFYQRRQQFVVPGQINPCEWTGAVYCAKSYCDVTPLRHKIRC